MRPTLLRRLGVAVVGTTLALAALSLPESSVAVAQDEEPCVEVFPISEVRAGMLGTGLTVSQGTTPEEFDVEVLGVLSDALMAGKDLILVEASSDAIDEAGGVWFGMSGSPVYIGDRLLGAVSWSLTYGVTPYVGLTPAADLIEITEYDEAPVDLEPVMRSPLSSRARARVAGMFGVPEEAVREAIVPLRIPVSISGVTSRSAEVKRTLTERGMRVVPYAGSSASPDFVTGSVLHPGDGVGVSWSYGDVTIGGTGTVAYVCEDKAVLFGHSIWGFYPGGQMALAGSEAPVVAVMADPIWGSSKISSLGPPIGRVDQDRFSGMRMLVGAPVRSIPVATTVTATTNGRTRDAATSITADSWVADIATWTLVANVDATYDHRSQGSASVIFTVSGTRESGQAFTVERSDMVSSNWDIAEEIGQTFFRVPQRLVKNRFEEIDITSVTASVTVGHDQHKTRVTKVLTQVDESGFSRETYLSVSPGQSIRMKVVLRDVETDERTVAFLRVRAPQEPGTGSLQVGGGKNLRVNTKSSTFEDLVQAIEDDYRANEIIAVTRGSRGRLADETRRAMQTVIIGTRVIDLEVIETP